MLLTHLAALLCLLLPALLMIAPWMLRNWFWLGNPFAPFLTSVAEEYGFGRVLAPLERRRICIAR